MTVKNIAGVIPISHNVASGISWVFVIAVAVAIVSGIGWAWTKIPKGPGRH